ncbi:MAG: TetR/AcrR family transcriptional regulator [Actinomycetota bacterium]
MGRTQWTADLEWVRTPRQTRSERTQTAVLDAAAALFAERGVDHASVSDIAARAGTSVGTIYHHFSDKQGLVFALFDRLAAELDATTADAVDPARWHGAGIADVLRGYLDFALDVGRTLPAFRIVSRAAAARDVGARELLEKLHRNIDEGVRALLLARAAEITHPARELAVDLVLDQIAAMLLVRLEPELRPSRLAELDDDAWIDETLHSALTHLGLTTD